MGDKKTKIRKSIKTKKTQKDKKAKSIKTKKTKRQQPWRLVLTSECFRTFFSKKTKRQNDKNKKKHKDKKRHKKTKQQKDKKAMGNTVTAISTSPNKEAAAREIGADK